MLIPVYTHTHTIINVIKIIAKNLKPLYGMSFLRIYYESFINEILHMLCPIPSQGYKLVLTFLPCILLGG